MRKKGFIQGFVFAVARGCGLLTIISWFIRGYRYAISPILGPCCRFQPSCSEYALEAIAEHGLLRSVFLILRRLFRCHPWGGQGYDPVPKEVNE